MASLIPYAVWLVLILCALSLVAVLVFGIRNLTYGKVNPLTVTLTFIPIALLAVLGFATGDWTWAGVIAVIVMLVITSITLLLSGIRGLIGL
jgi:hypothetical protein